MSVYAIGEHHLTEQELAQSKFDFDLEDVVYIRLDPLEAKLQQLQDRRILDNQYMFSLSPAARRWYELMAAKIFGVVTNRGQFCEIRYSWYIQHHHTLKRQYQRFRVVEQMKRIVRDHMESGYIAKVEYRAVKEPDQEIDYIIRYYPGPGATASLDRVQTHIRQRRISHRPSRRLHQGQQGTAAITHEQSQPSALSVITADHQSLIIELTFRFGVSMSKAYDLALSRTEAVKLQLEMWPFRQVAPHNRAGWMIQAIENNYQAPASYLQHKQHEHDKRKLATAQTAVQQCELCDGSGFRYIKSNQYPNGAMRQCSHDPALESNIPK